jgi:UDP-N-acetylglucosamine 2-epimerase (non-hydrolysing)
LKVLHVVGARPNFMKIAPIMREMSCYSDTFQQILIHTGQHYDSMMSKVFFDELKIPPPDINLDVGSGSHTWQTAQVMLKLEPEILKHQPDLVVVVGDVNSTLAAALVSSKLGIPIAHVESGLRSFDHSMPEELNRVLTDQLAEFLFTPSLDADQNLIREGIPEEKIHLVGNVMIDSLISLLPKAEENWEKIKENYTLDRYILVTLHRPANVDEPHNLTEILTALERISTDIQIIFPVHPRTTDRLSMLGIDFQDTRLTLIDPLGYLDFLALESHATLVITDSGGVQEETTYLGIPCLTIRPNTERPITISIGTNQLVSPHSSELIEAIQNKMTITDSLLKIPPLWDGHTAERIVDVIAEWGKTDTP